MTADVYAADDGLSNGKQLPPSDRTHTIEVVADAEPDVLLRVAALLNVLNQAPKRVLLLREVDETVRITIVVCGCTIRAVELICRKLEQLTCVRQIATVENVTSDGRL